MEEEKSWVYTLVLGVCMLLSLALIGRMLVGHPHSADRSGDTAEPDDLPQASDAIEWTADDLSEMTAQALPFTADDLTVQISRAGTVTLELTVSKTALSQIGLLEGRMRTALLFLPESCALHGQWRPTLTDGRIVLTECAITAAGLTLPEALTAKLSERLSAALNDRLAVQMPASPQAMELSDGAIRFTA